MKPIKTFVAALLAAASPAMFAIPAAAAEAKAAPLSEEAVQARVDALLAQMTPEEKAGQLAILFDLGYPQLREALQQKAAAGTLGSVLFQTDPKEINRLQRLALEKSRLKIPMLFGFDVIHGLRTIFPVPIANAASWDPDGVARAQAVAAREARAVGLHWTFAPMVDIGRDPRWGRVVEGAGEDTYLGSAMGAAQVRGFQGAFIGSPDHIIAGPKHFAAYGAAAGGRDYDEVNVSDSELWNTYLPPFKAAIDAGAGNIMSAYMGVNGIPATGNHWLLTDVLRKTWGFKGFVVSDADAVNSLTVHGFAPNNDEAAARALQAGADMEMALFKTASSALPKLLASGRISQADLDTSVRRVLAAKVRMGLFEKPYVDEARSARVLADPASLEAARVAAERAAVLLRNEGSLLPLDRAKIRSIAVIGPLANSARDSVGPWVFDQNKPVTSAVLDGIKAKAGAAIKVEYAPGVALPKRLNPSPFEQLAGTIVRPVPEGGDDAGIAAAEALARKSDVAVVVVGEAQDMIGEAASRSSLDLPGRQQELLDRVVATGKPVVVLVMNGRPLDLKDTKAPAILDIWYPGSQAAPAVANLLFGDAVPGGKLPFTWPRTVGQVPLYYNPLNSHEPTKVEQRYWDANGKPAWPFGFGLSYSRFTFGPVSIDKTEIDKSGQVVVSADLTNAGKVQADEVAQLYVHQRAGTAARPVRELKGFQRVTLRPGETRRISFTLRAADVQYWNAATHAWTIDEATFNVGIGGDSTAPMPASFSITGANR